MIKFGRLTTNSIYNLAGSALPLIVGVITIPRLIHSLGVERFGILTLTWAVMGYFSLFDLGLGRALTQIVAEHTGISDKTNLPDIIHTALIMMLVFGTLGGLCLIGISPLLIGKFLKLSPNLHTEAYFAFCLMGISIPAVTMLAGVRGILEAKQHFLILSILRGVMGAWTFLGPWLVSYWTVHLFWVVLSLEIMRYTSLFVHYLICRHLVAELKLGGQFRSNHWSGMWRFGGWMTLSNIISPLMVSMDRFFIGAFISVGAIAYYSTPFEIVTKAFAISNAFVTVLFPMFGSMYRIDPEGAYRVYWNGLKSIFSILAPALLVLGLGANYIFFHWLGPNFSNYSSTPMRILCLGVLINALAAVPYAYIQGAARPDLTTKFHLLEVPFYLAGLWFLGTHFGILGVAWAWVMRVMVDLFLLLITADHLQKTHWSKLVKPVAASLNS